MVGLAPTEEEMASETVKILLMIVLFCSLQTALHLPRLINSQMGKRCRRPMTLLPAYWPTHMPVAATLRGSRRRGSISVALSAAVSQT